MAWGSIVQSKTGATAQGGASTLTVTMDSAITEGNLLVAFAASRAATMATPSGWSAAQSGLDGTNTDCLYLYYKLAGSSESTSVLFNDSTSNQVIAADVWEVEGGWESSPYDTGNNNLSGQSSVDPATCATGASGTFAQSDIFVAAGWSWRNSIGGVSIVSTAIDSSFTEQTDGSALYADYTGSLYATHVATAYRMPGATTSLNPTCSFYGSYGDSGNDSMIGVIAGFKKSATGGTVVPIIVNHLRQQGIL